MLGIFHQFVALGIVIVVLDLNKVALLQILAAQNSHTNALTRSQLNRDPETFNHLDEGVLGRWTTSPHPYATTPPSYRHNSYHYDNFEVEDNHYQGEGDSDFDHYPVELTTTNNNIINNNFHTQFNHEDYNLNHHYDLEAELEDSVEVYVILLRGEDKGKRRSMRKNNQRQLKPKVKKIRLTTFQLPEAGSMSNTEATTLRFTVPSVISKPAVARNPAHGQRMGGINGKLKGKPYMPSHRVFNHVEDSRFVMDDDSEEGTWFGDYGGDGTSHINSPGHNNHHNKPRIQPNHHSQIEPQFPHRMSTMQSGGGRVLAPEPSQSVDIRMPLRPAIRSDLNQFRIAIRPLLRVMN